MADVGTLSRLLRVPGALRVMMHLRRAGEDYGRSVAAALGMPLDEAIRALEALESMGLARGSWVHR
ncbi:MAG: DUF2250 domain-containing protein [Conexivisphaera sp.]